MQDYIHHQNSGLISPTHFLNSFDAAPMPVFFLGDSHDNNFCENNQYDQQPEIQQKLQEGTKTSSKDEKKRLAGARSRQKKKNYVNDLEEKVKQLSAQLDNTENELSKCKDNLVQALKSTKNQSNQHTFTFAELQRHTTDEDPDIDRINFLLDLIQNRIGANGKERQANLDYNFKQIINSMFPAMHRYFMHTAKNSQDIFQPEKSTQQTQKSWTKQLFLQLALSENQVSKIAGFKNDFLQKRQGAIQHIKRLKEMKRLLKEQEEKFENAMSDIREDMTPIQSALITVFGQKNKLRKEFSLGQLQMEMETQYESIPSKKVKVNES